jgi:hypothetical protein
VENGKLNDNRIGIFGEQSLHPGTEMYLTVTARPESPTRQCRTRVTRSFGPIDQFRTAEPYTVELLLRLESNPADVERIAVFGTSPTVSADETRVWQVQAGRTAADDDLVWRIGCDHGDETRYNTLPVAWWKSYRCFVDVDPQRGIRRATVSNQQSSVSNKWRNTATPAGPPHRQLTLGFESTGRKGKAVRFSIDAICIQDRPSIDR